MTDREHDLLIQLYEHKMALYQMLDQFGYTVTIDGKTYIDNLCESAEEQAFKALGLHLDTVSLREFYTRWDCDEDYLCTLRRIDFKPYHLDNYLTSLKQPTWNKLDKNES